MNYRVRFLNHQIKKNIVFYSISVHDLNSEETWVFNTRYSYKNELPRFPNKRCFGNTDPRFIEYRKKALENYLNTILINIGLEKMTVLYEFLMFAKSGKYNALSSTFSNNFSSKIMNKFEISSDFNPSFEEKTFPGIKSKISNNDSNLYISKMSQNVNNVKNLFIDVTIDIDYPDEDNKLKKQEKFLKLKKNGSESKLKKILKLPKNEKKFNSENLLKKTIIEENREIFESIEIVMSKLEGKFKNDLKIQNSFVFHIKS